MQIVDVMKAAQGGDAVTNLARAFNLSPGQAEAVINAVVPQLTAALERNTLSRGGLADLVQALGHGHHEAVLNTPAALGRADIRDDGDRVLGHILGSKDRSRAVAEKAAFTSGVSSTLIKMMLPYLASWLMGSLSKSMKGGLGDIISRVPGGGGGGAGWPSGGGGMGGQIPELPRMPEGGGIQIPGFPPSSGNTPQGREQRPWPTGGRMEDIGREQIPSPSQGGGGWPGASGGFGGGGGSPLPLPGDTVPGIPGNSRNPYGDLSDILRRGMGLPGGQGNAPQVPIPAPGGGGMSIPGGAVGGGLLWSIVRSLLGGALGFRGGLMSWIFRMVFVKFGWGILRRLLMGR